MAWKTFHHRYPNPSINQIDPINESIAKLIETLGPLHWNKPKEEEHTMVTNVVSNPVTNPAFFFLGGTKGASISGWAAFQLAYQTDQYEEAKHDAAQSVIYNKNDWAELVEVASQTVIYKIWKNRQGILQTWERGSNG